MNKEKEIIKDFFDERASTWDDKSRTSLSFVKEMFLKSGIKEGEEVIDLACGTGVISGLLNSITKKPVLGIDLSPNMIECARNKYKDNNDIDFVVADFVNYVGVPKDAIYMFNAYPHFLDLEKLKIALYNNLKEHGRFVICSDLSLEKVKFHHRYCMHVSRTIESLKEDFDTFKDKFDIIINEDDENHYLVVGIKK